VPNRRCAAFAPFTIFQLHTFPKRIFDAYWKRIMNWFEFRSRMFDLGCFSIHQVYAWQPEFDRNNFVRWTRKGFTIRRTSACIRRSRFTG